MKTLFQKSALFWVLAFTTLSARSDSFERRMLLHTVPQPQNGEIKVAFFDADSTLRISRAGAISAQGPADVVLLPGVSEKIRLLNQDGFLIAIVSNQGGIPEFISFQDANLALAETIRQIQAAGGIVHYYDFADKADEFRKPNIGMFEELNRILKSQLSLSIDTKQSFMVGDAAYTTKETRPDGRTGSNFSNSDRLFAENAGIKFLEPQDFFGWNKYGIEVFKTMEEIAKFKQLSSRRCSDQLMVKSRL